MKAANTHDVSLKRGGDQPAAFGAAEVVAADVETLNVRCVTDDVSDVGGIVGGDGVVAEVDVGDVSVCDNCSGSLFQSRLVDALE